MAALATCNAITLRGSVDIVCEFFDYAINNILYQRGVYPIESFRREEHYGLTMYAVQEDALRRYLSNLLTPLKRLSCPPFFFFENTNPQPTVHCTLLLLLAHTQNGCCRDKFRSW